MIASSRGRQRRGRAVTLRVDGLEQRLVLSVSVTAVTSAAAVAKLQTLSLPGGDANRVSSTLLLGYARAAGLAVNSQLQNADSSSVMPLMTDAQGRVGVAITTATATTLAPILTSLGVNVISVLPLYNRLEAYIPWSKLPTISNLGSKGVMGIIGIPKPMTSAGLVTSEGVNVMEADRVQASTPGYTGAGVKVGVLSDSYNSRGGAAADIASGDLPASGVQVLQDSSGSDEGRAMLQIVHDVAPGASLAFATANGGEGNFAANIRGLANAGAKVITDDVFYFDEPFFQPSIIAQAVNDVVANKGVSYFSSAGNLDTQGYDTASPQSYGSSPLHFTTDASFGGSWFDFNPGAGTNDRMTLTLAAGQALTLGFQWDQPFYTTSGVTSDLDIYLVQHNSTTIVAGSASDNLLNQTPLEIFGYQNTTGAPQQYDLMINLYAGATPGELKFVNYGANSYGDVNFGTFATNSATVNSHAAVASAMGVGAVPFYDQRTPESFTSFGPVTFLFDAAGNRLTTPEMVAKPDFSAPDGVSTTFFGGSFINGYPNFFGTSAAAPHAAGVAALILQAKPNDTPAQIYSLLKSTADPNIGAGNPNQVGAGLIDAYKAIFGGPVPVYASTTDNFESGALGTQWQVYTGSAGRVQVTSDGGPASGAYQLVLSGNLDGYQFPHLDEAIMHVNLAGRTGSNLTFDQKYMNNFNNTSPTAMPSTFTGHNNSTGVAFSVDGTHWYRITSLGSSSSTPYSTLSFNLSAIAASYGVTLGADTQIKFQDYNAKTGFAPDLGLALDNVVVSAHSVLTQNVIDIGAAQRSAVRSLTLKFQGQVTTLPTSAFGLKRTEDGQTFPVVVGAPVYSGGMTTVVLTFGGANLNGSSLPDGRYVLTVAGSQILDNLGNPVDAANNGVAGSAGTISFFRFFGDSNGDGVVDATDYLAFRAAYNSHTVTAANSYFDYDGDGMFSALDLNMFTVNFTKRKLI
ncbi:MAG: S8 family serine peptidase [Paludisphaera borealis]|uniref:S8 family serine peptidase n=1 Tax=Paludisphaera borealis TaxID=1387353 RepID=UPI00285023E5|nr:S8 family serine peptidase [Paludisphaera borealis]MDR3619281.1 S8 family serine peptidase [Paludisphaera borealis]